MRELQCDGSPKVNLQLERDIGKIFHRKLAYDNNYSRHIHIIMLCASKLVVYRYRYGTNDAAVSGETPKNPVISTKSGNIYEKSLIEAYLTENGTEPTTGQILSIDDLLDVRSSQTVRPRPPTLTSIPALLGVFQEEWDALALETYTLQQNLLQARRELSTALYHHDAAVRVIARLTKERDEAREALARINVGERASTSNGTNGDAMQVDNAPLPDTVLEKIQSTQQQYVTLTSCWLLITNILQINEDKKEATCTRRLGYGREYFQLQTSHYVGTNLPGRPILIMR